MELSRERRHESSFQTIDDFKFVVQLAGSPFQFSRSRPILSILDSLLGVAAPSPPHPSSS